MTDASMEGSEAGDAADAAKKKSGKVPMIAGLVLAILGGAGGYFAVSEGLLFGSDELPASKTSKDDALDIPAMYDGQTAADIRFVELSPLLVSLGPDSDARHLRFKAAIETIPGAEDDVAALEPRILDVMNGYLRALTPADIEARDALFVIRAHLTRRLQLVLGEERMLDLLVMEFVLN